MNCNIIWFKHSCCSWDELKITCVDFWRFTNHIQHRLQFQTKLVIAVHIVSTNHYYMFSSSPLLLSQLSVKPVHHPVLRCQVNLWSEQRRHCALHLLYDKG